MFSTESESLGVPLLGRVVKHDHEVVEVLHEFGEGGVADGGHLLRLHYLHGPGVDLAVVVQVAVGGVRDRHLHRQRDAEIARH